MTARLPYDGSEARARRLGPEASAEAARSISEDGLSAAKRIVLSTLRLARRPLADHELIAAVRRGFPTARLTDSSIRSRRKELVRRGLVVEVGDLGRTPSGRSCQKFKAVT